ncbi:MAG TPA: hypothetical protein VEC60_17215 [Reyranella sp.]|nr:hypothetical protein [Reyranella sp.]
MKQSLKRALQLALVPLAAAIVFFEDVLIRYLNRVTAAIAAWPPIARLEAWLVRLPPYWALLAFAAPSVLILPVKVAAFWFGLHGRYALALASVIAGKLLATAILARLYRILRPSLMAIPWFSWADTRFFAWRDRIYGFVKALPAWQMAAAAVRAMRARMTELVSTLLAR